MPSAKLLAGEVPPELEEIFDSAGAPLFPTSAGDLDQHCSCPDWGVPCKHIAAVFYLLAEAFDADPFLILLLRGRGRDELLARLRELRSGVAADAADTDTDNDTDTDTGEEAPASIGTATALAGLSWPGGRGERFWQPPPPLPDRPTMLEVEPDVLLRQLPVPAAGLGGEALTGVLRRAYATFDPARDPLRP